MRAEVYGYSSASGWMEQNSVNTTPQPPSAFIPRKWACAPGLSDPGPAQCEVCQNRLRVFRGPILTDSNNTSCFGSRDMISSFLLPTAADGVRIDSRVVTRLFILTDGESGPTFGTIHHAVCGKSRSGHRLDHRDR